MNAPQSNDSSVVKIADVAGALKLFKLQICINRGVYKQLNDSLTRSFSGKAGELVVAVYNTGEETFFDFSRENHFIVLKVRHDEPNISLYRASISNIEVVKWIRHAIKNWGGIQKDESVVIETSMRTY